MLTMPRAVGCAYQVTGMAKALRSAENCQVLASHPSLTFRNGEYTYQILRQSGRSLYKVSYRDESISVTPQLLFRSRRNRADLPASAQ